MHLPNPTRQQHPSRVCGANCHAIFAKQNPTNTLVEAALNRISAGQNVATACARLFSCCALNCEDGPHRANRSASQAADCSGDFVMFLIVVPAMPTRAIGESTVHSLLAACPIHLERRTLFKAPRVSV
jgi:hypothetical protein